MASIDKLIDKLRRQPNGISPTEMEKVLLAIGYISSGATGSHKQFRQKGKPIYTLVISKNPVKAYQVKELLKIIDEE